MTVHHNLFVSEKDFLRLTARDKTLARGIASKVRESFDTSEGVLSIRNIADSQILKLVSIEHAETFLYAQTNRPTKWDEDDVASIQDFFNVLTKSRNNLLEIRAKIEEQSSQDPNDIRELLLEGRELYIKHLCNILAYEKIKQSWDPELFKEAGNFSTPRIAEKLFKANMDAHMMQSEADNHDILRTPGILLGVLLTSASLTAATSSPNNEARAITLIMALFGAATTGYMAIRGKQADQLRRDRDALLRETEDAARMMSYEIYYEEATPDTLQ